MLNTVTFIPLSDVLTALGIEDIHDYGDPFNGVSYGDAVHTLMPLPWVLDSLGDFCESRSPTWSPMDYDPDVFSDNAHELLNSGITLVDMEN